MESRVINVEILPEMFTWCGRITPSVCFVGLVAVIFSISSRIASSTDYEGARVKGQISMFISIAGIIVTVIGGLVVVLIFFTKDA